MKKYQVIETAQILTPNKEHRNFTDTGSVIDADTIIEGNPVEIKGLRKGEPFTYRMFRTKNNQLIYIKKVKPMETTNVTLGIEGSRDTSKATVVKLPNESMISKRKVAGALIGAGIGFAYCKYKKHDNKKTAMYVAIGGVLGYLGGVYADAHSGIKVKK